MCGRFNLYWYQDCFNQCTACAGRPAGELVLQGACQVVKGVTKCTPHFFVFHWQVASTGAGAAALNTLISQVLHIGMVSTTTMIFFVVLWSDQ